VQDNVASEQIGFCLLGTNKLFRVCLLARLRVHYLARHIGREQFEFRIDMFEVFKNSRV